MQTPPNSPRLSRHFILPLNDDDDEIPELIPIHWPIYHIFGFWIWPLVGNV